MELRETDSDARRFRAAVVTALAATCAAIIVYLFNSGLAGLGPLVVAATAVFLSKLSIFGGNLTQNPFNPWELGLIAWVLDVWVVCALLAGISSFKRLPLAGRALAEAHARAGVTLLEYPGLRRLAFWGIAILVFLPIPGSGAVTGTLVGQLVGLTRMGTFVAVVIGAGTAVMTYAAVAVFLGSQFENLLTSPLVLAVCILAFVLFLWWAWLKVKRELQRG